MACNGSNQLEDYFSLMEDYFSLVKVWCLSFGKESRAQVMFFLFCFVFLSLLYYLLNIALIFMIRKVHSHTHVPASRKR